MIELANTLLPDLPKSLYWVYGVVYIIQCIAFFGMLLSPMILLFSVGKRKRF